MYVILRFRVFRPLDPFCIRWKGPYCRLLSSTGVDALMHVYEKGGRLAGPHDPTAWPGLYLPLGPQLALEARGWALPFATPCVLMPEVSGRKDTTGAGILPLFVPGQDTTLYSRHRADPRFR